MRREKGFTLIELLIVVAIIGIIAAIAIPNLLNAIDRSKQKRTMADMRSVGTAVEEYAIDNNFYPVQTTQNDMNQGSPTVAQILENNSAYIKLTPRKDGWNKEIQYGTPTAGTSYTLRSFGKDTVISTNTAPGGFNDFNCDIVFQQGQFVSFPQGIQT